MQMKTAFLLDQDYLMEVFISFPHFQDCMK
jgi:hypothetical protein